MPRGEDPQELWGRWIHAELLEQRQFVAEEPRLLNEAVLDSPLDFQPTQGGVGITNAILWFYLTTFGGNKRACERFTSKAH